MAKEKNEQKLTTVPIAAKTPSIKKIVECPKCKSKIMVEHEIELDMVIPSTLAGALAQAGKQVEEEHDKD